MIFGVRFREWMGGGGSHRQKNISQGFSFEKKLAPYELIEDLVPPRCHAAKRAPGGVGGRVAECAIAAVHLMNRAGLDIFEIEDSILFIF